MNVTGTHWLYEIIRMIKDQTTEYGVNSKFNEWLDVQPYEQATSVRPSGSRILNTHVPISCVPPNFR